MIFFPVYFLVGAESFRKPVPIPDRVADKLFEILHGVLTTTKARPVCAGMGAFA